MPFTLTMPKLSPTMEEGTIVKWCKHVGDKVEAGEILMEVATDKATVEHAALDGGYLRKVLIEEGKEAIVNQAIAIFTEKADESIEGYVPEGEIKKTAPVVASTAAAAVAEAPVSKSVFAEAKFSLEPPLEDYQFTSPLGDKAERLFASPLAKKLAEEKGLDLSTVKGTGAKGRITAKDLERAQKEGLAVFGSRKKPEHIPGSYAKENLSPMRKSIAKRLQESKTFIPHFYVDMAIQVDELVRLRDELKHGGVKLTFNDFIVKAAAMALREHKALNSAFDGDSIAYFNTIDIAIAVSIEGGLITPLIRCADFKNLGEISTEVKELAERARLGKLTPQEYKGGSFTISNLGMFGVTRFTAIINPPQSAILAVGGVLDQAVVKEGVVVPGKVMNLTLSCDHRVVDGAAAAAFLNTVKNLLEHPSLLIIH